MKLNIWYRASYKGMDFDRIVKRVSDEVIFHEQFGGWISYEVLTYPSYSKSGFVPDNWELTELSSLEQELL